MLEGPARTDFRRSGRGAPSGDAYCCPSIASKVTHSVIPAATLWVKVVPERKRLSLRHMLRGGAGVVQPVVCQAQVNFRVRIINKINTMSAD